MIGCINQFPTGGESAGDARVGAAMIVHHHGNSLLWGRLIVHLTEIGLAWGGGNEKDTEYTHTHTDVYMVHLSKPMKRIHHGEHTDMIL